MRLKSCTISNKGLILSSEPSPCFTLNITLGPKCYKAYALLDSGASACFLDEQFVKSRKIPFVQKPKPVHV